MFDVIFALLAIVVIVLYFVKWKFRKYDGEILIIIDDTGKKVYSLELDLEPEEIDSRKDILFRVRKLTDVA